MRGIYLAVVAYIGLGSAGQAQDNQAPPTPVQVAPVTAPGAAPTADVPPVPACELHIWPAERFMAMTSGLLGGGLLDMAIHAEKDKNNRTQMANALSSEGQVDALASLGSVDKGDFQEA